jgi:type IV pilus assembly protein PilE
MTRSPGFTLIEVMIVLLIMSVLAALAYPGYAGYITRARRAEGQVALMNAMQQQEQHRAIHHSYVAFSSAAPVDGLPWWSGNRAPDSAYELEAHACPGSELRDCVQVSARPGTARVDARHSDPECGTLTLTSTGEQGASVSGSGRAGRCWP